MCTAAALLLTQANIEFVIVPAKINYIFIEARMSSKYACLMGILLASLYTIPAYTMPTIGSGFKELSYELARRERRAVQPDANESSLPQLEDVAQQISDNTLSSQNTIYALQSLDGMAWDYYLLAAPLSVAYIGLIMALSFKHDVPFNRPTAAELASLKGSTGLKMAMVHINSQAVNAFSLVDANMQRLRTQSGAIEGFVEGGLEDFDEKHPAKLLADLLKINFGLIDAAARDCARYANDTSAAFGTVRQMIDAVMIGTSATEAERIAAIQAMNDTQQLNAINAQQLKEENANLAEEIEEARAMVRNATESVARYREQAAVAPMFEMVTKYDKDCSSLSVGVPGLAVASYESCSTVTFQVSAPLPIQSATVYVPRLKKNGRKANLPELQAQATAAGARDYLTELDGVLGRISNALSSEHASTPSNPTQANRQRRQAADSNSSAIVGGETEKALKATLAGGELKFGEQIPLLSSLAKLFPGAAPVLNGFQNVVGFFRNASKGLSENSQAGGGAVAQAITQHLQSELKAETTRSFSEPAAKFDMSQVTPPDPVDSADGTKTIYGVHAAIDAQALRAEFEAELAREKLDEAKQKHEANLAMLDKVATDNARISLDLLTAKEIIELARKASNYLSYLQSSWLQMSMYFQRIAGFVYQLQQTDLREINAYLNCEVRNGSSTTCEEILIAKKTQISKIYKAQIWPNANVVHIASTLYLKASIGHILLPMSSLVGLLNLRNESDIPAANGRIWSQCMASLAKIHSYINAQHATFEQALAQVDGSLAASRKLMIAHANPVEIAQLRQIVNSTLAEEKIILHSQVFGGFLD